MRKSVFVLTVIGAACSSVAFAAEIKKDKAHVPAVKATTMSDAQMDKVTAGANTNVFADSAGFPNGKVTGSFNLFTLTGPNAGLINGDHGAANLTDHFAIKK
ncbi:MAG: hypothetical protein WA838_11740 [Xanthobacteraceae bacterium]|jgi:hypothetical protein